MGRLNLRLIFSLFAVSTVLLLLAIPSTRAILQRSFWLLTGNYLRHTEIPEEDYTGTAGMTDDYRIFVLLKAYGRIPSEGRSFELAKIAATKNDPAMWGHVIRQTGTMTIQTDLGNKYTQMDRFRRNSLASLEVTAAKEGQSLAPDNAFFYLSEATGLAKMGRWKEVAAPLRKGASLTKFEDYTFDQGRRQVNQLYRSLDPVLPSDLGGDWSMIILPHFSNYSQLSRNLGLIPSEKDRVEAAFALASIGRTMAATGDMDIQKFSGDGLVLRSARSVLGLDPAKQKNSEMSELIPRLEAQAKALGLADVASGWATFSDWKKYQSHRSEEMETVPVDVYPMTLTHALFALAWVAAMGFALWMASSLDFNFGNLMTLACGMMAASLIGFGMVEHPLPLVGLFCGSTLLFCSLVSLRLPGKRQASWMLGVGGAVLVAATAFFMDNLQLGIVLLGVWTVPFLISTLTRWTIPTLVSTIIVTLGLGIAIAFIASSLPDNPKLFEHQLLSSIQTLWLVSGLGLPLIAGYVMAFSKANLNDALKIILRPIPFFALGAAAALLWGMRQQVILQDIWTQLTSKELSPRYKQAIIDAQRQAEVLGPAPTYSPAIRETAVMAPTAEK